jgi:hypothetical protein
VPSYANLRPQSRTETVMKWIVGLGWDDTEEEGWPLRPGSLIIDEPDQVVFITGTGGPGYVTEEGSADAWSFQTRVRGAPNEPFEPEATAQRLDNMILAAPFPANIGGMHVQHVHRQSSPPAALPVDPGDLRHQFTCNYILIAGE